MIKAVAVLALIFSLATAETQMIETDDFLKGVAYDKNGNSVNIYEWTMPLASKAISWSEGGVGWSEKGFERKGKVYFSNQGTITHRSVGETIKNGYWTILFVGNKERLMKVVVVPGEATQENPSFNIEKVYIKKKMICKNSKKLKSYLYLIKYPGKKPFWVKEKISISPKGRASGYMITFDRRPKCEIGDMQQTEKEKVVSNCQLYAGNEIQFKYIETDKAIGACELAMEIDSENKEVLYLLGRSYKKAEDYKNAIKWYRKSSDLGYDKAQYAVGSMFLKGQGIKKSPLMAKVYFEKASEQGYNKALVGLGVMYIKGIGGKKDYAEAEKYFRKAMSGGDKTAEQNLKRLKKLIQRENLKLKKEEQSKQEKQERNKNKEELPKKQKDKKENIGKKPVENNTFKDTKQTKIG